jgi:hypothetical protein
MRQVKGSTQSAKIFRLQFAAFCAQMRICPHRRRASQTETPMAKTIKRDGNSRMDAGELRALLDSASEQAAKAAEFTAEHGNILRNGLERFGVDRTAFTLARKLYKMEESRREGTLRDFIRLCGLLGFFDQRSAFEDVYQALVEKLGGSRQAKA